MYNSCITLRIPYYSCDSGKNQLLSTVKSGGRDIPCRKSELKKTSRWTALFVVLSVLALRQVFCPRLERENITKNPVLSVKRNQKQLVKESICNTYAAFALT